MRAAAFSFKDSEFLSFARMPNLENKLAKPFFVVGIENPSASHKSTKGMFKLA